MNLTEASSLTCKVRVVSGQTLSQYIYTRYDAAVIKVKGQFHSLYSFKEMFDLSVDVASQECSVPTGRSCTVMINICPMRFTSCRVAQFYLRLKNEFIPFKAWSTCLRRMCVCRAFITTHTTMSALYINLRNFVLGRAGNGRFRYKPRNLLERTE
jgi:hypothetical protein